MVCILLAVFLFIGTAGSVFAQSGESGLQRILESGVIRVGTTGDFRPMSYKDPRTGKYEGFDIELVERLAADIGVKVEWVATDWRNLVSGIAAGKYDITTGASYNMGRAKSAGYTLPVVEVGTVPVIQKRDAAKYRTWEDIDVRGTTVVVTLGTVFEDQVRTMFSQATIKAVESPARDFQEVLSGRANVAITSNIEAANLVAAYPNLAIVPVAPKNSNGIGLLVAQNDQILINYINVWVTMRIYDGYLEQLKRKWLAGN